ncbi:MAG: Integrase catalytic region [Verrucomicrobia bacterium]|nr:Integrase catalytic region [Verrucomicrobiota bacterium]
MLSNQAEEEQKRRDFVYVMLKRQVPLATICAAQGRSRQWGYKWWGRFELGGWPGLVERSRCPRSACRLRRLWRKRCERLRRRYPHWGTVPLRALLRADYPRQHVPGLSTMARWLVAAQLVRRRVRRSRPGPAVPRPPWRVARHANDVWTIDFKGKFWTADGARVEPFTVRDLASKYLLAVEHLGSPSDRAVRAVLTRLFRRWGLPRAIHVDNGAPFAGRGALGLSTLSVWWLRLGIEVEFSRRARPGDNAGHEHMHGILKRETARPAAANLPAQLRRLARWRHRYNHIRPHRALRLQTPASRYRGSRRRWPRILPPWSYPPGWSSLQPGRNGRAWWAGRQRFFGRAFAQQCLGLAPPTSALTSVYLGATLIGTLHCDDRGGMRPARHTTPFHSCAARVR